MKNSGLIVTVAIVLVVAGLLVYFLYHPAQNNVFISLTDPANVPIGTQGLSITYSSLMVHTISGNTSGWVNVAGSGTLNLLSMLNVSSILGALYLQNGSYINLVRFNVTSSTIEINNTVYPVTLSNNQLTASVLRDDGVNGTTNILLQLSPTVMPILTRNSTRFMLVPSLRAVMVSNSALRGSAAGDRRDLNREEELALNQTRLNITLSNAVLSTVGNTTQLSVVVTDNSNNSVILRHVTVFGNQSVVADHFSINSPGIVSRDQSGNFSSGDNSSRGNLSYSSNESEREVEYEGLAQAEFRTVNFLVNQNGTLTLPSLESNFENANYNLSSGQSVTLTFSNPILLGENNVLVKFVTNSTYRLVVQGNQGARATVNVIAS